ncbi:MAG: hypothetical protein Kow0098_04460 [Ignavibacteriaceae bacterium]
MEADIKDYIFPEPLLFNCWKHHLKFIKEKIKEFSNPESFNEKLLNSSILTIGGSVTDIYLGALPPDKISNEILQYIRLNGLDDINNYRKWLYKEGRDYRLVRISDKSLWTLRTGEDDKRFVHIHPARNTELTLRVKATTLKTAILVLIMSEMEHKKSDNLHYINETRKKYLSLPPVKSAGSSGKLLTLISLLN